MTEAVDTNVRTGSYETHLNRAGAAGWQAYDRGAISVANEPHRLHRVTYSLRRQVS